MKVLLLDADGVILKKTEYFSEHFAREHGVPLEIMLPFYRGEFQLCQRGEADMKVELAKYLPQWHWAGSADEFVSLWFSTDVHFDEIMAARVSEIRASGIICCLVSNQEKYRGEYLRERLMSMGIFDTLFFSYELGVHKSNPVFFEKVVQSLNVTPGDILYFDNDQKNIDAAGTFGIDAKLYTGIEMFNTII